MLDEPRSLRRSGAVEPRAALARDVDGVARAHRLKTASFAVFGGGVLGVVPGILFWAFAGSSILYVPVGALAGFLFVYLLVGGISGSAGALTNRLHNPSGTIPYQQQYSHAQSLAVRGRYREALDAYELCVVQNPGEPEPYLRIARMLRDEMKEPEEAARWFRKVRTAIELPRGQELLVFRELIEIYRNRLADPARAAPELARMAERFAGTPDGEWAAAELTEVKEMIRQERG